ncbi:hypothetical protein CROQUDRAFT_664072, partial [Cronartium quercuum f. sp. fusiforme G11]
MKIPLYSGNKKSLTCNNHVPTRIEAPHLINRLLIYLNNDQSQLAEKASTILCQLSDCLHTQHHIQSEDNVSIHLEDSE